MMLLIGESAMSFAPLVNGAVVNVRGRVSKFLPVLELFGDKFGVISIIGSLTV